MVPWGKKNSNRKVAIGQPTKGNIKLENTLFSIIERGWWSSLKLIPPKTTILIINNNPPHLAVPSCLPRLLMSTSPLPSDMLHLQGPLSWHVTAWQVTCCTWSMMQVHVARSNSRRGHCRAFIIVMFSSLFKLLFNTPRVDCATCWLLHLLSAPLVDCATCCLRHLLTATLVDCDTCWLRHLLTAPLVVCATCCLRHTWCSAGYWWLVSKEWRTYRSVLDNDDDYVLLVCLVDKSTFGLGSRKWCRVLCFWDWLGWGSWYWPHNLCQSWLRKNMIRL